MKNKVITGCFLLFIILTAAVSGCPAVVFQTAKDAASAAWKTVCAQQESDASITDQISECVADGNDSLLDRIPYRTAMLELSGTLLKAAGTRSYYNISNKMNITTSGYNVGRYDQTSTDYEVQEITDFKNYLDFKGIQLLYVSKPAKYIDDAYYREQFGGESYLNQNTDLFLQRISEAGIDYLDLRDCIKEEGLDSMELFYRTDHHWTVPASKWAAERISEKLNADYGYDIDLSLFDDQAFESTEYKQAWLGEQGKKVSKSYLGLDDYTVLKPLYETSYCVTKADGTVTHEGDFGIFINEDVYTSDDDCYEASSWHYSYKDYTKQTIHNKNIEKGNILVLGDSYESSMAPFLSLGISNLMVIVPRNIKKSVRDYIEEGNYDTVIIAYAQFMIGAHDNPTSANYKMFTLD